MNFPARHRACPVCLSGEQQPIHAMEFALSAESPLPAHYVITACASCGMVYADSTACQADYDHYYAQFSKYEDEKTASGGGYSEHDRRRLAEVAALLAQHTDKTASVLDVGCANGGMLEAMAGAGFSGLAGVDPSPASIRHVRQRGFRGEVSNIATLTTQNIGVFDLVILSHVLEHVFDISKTLAILRALMADDGLLYVEVPDAEGYVSHPAVPYYYFDSEHINHFNRGMLKKMALLHGFTVVAAARKELAVTDIFSYPAVYVLLRKCVGIPSCADQQDDPGLASAIRHYVDTCADGECQQKIVRYARSGEPVIIWGAGSHTQRLLGSTALSACRIVAIVDNDSNKHGLMMCGVRVSSPAALHAIAGTILVAAALHASAITAEIRAMRLPNPVDILA